MDYPQIVKCRIIISVSKGNNWHQTSLKIWNNGNPVEMRHSEKKSKMKDPSAHLFLAQTLKRRAAQWVDTFLELSSIVRMLLARSCEVPNLSTIWWVGSRRSSITIARTRSMFSSVGAVEAFRTLASSLTPSLPCSNLLTQHLSVAHDRGPSPYVPYISSWIYHGVIPFNCGHLKIVRYSLFSIFPQTQNTLT